MNQRNPMQSAATRLTRRDDSVGLMPAAERELAAFLAAVRQGFGPAAAVRAGDLWLEALSATELNREPQSFDWRKITIAAASSLAKVSVLEHCHSNHS